MFKTVAGGVSLGVILGSGVPVPPEIWPLLGFIVVVYTLMAVWELHVLLPEPRPRPKKPVESADPTSQRPLPAQTRSSTA